VLLTVTRSVIALAESQKVNVIAYVRRKGNCLELMGKAMQPKLREGRGERERRGEEKRRYPPEQTGDSREERSFEIA